MLLTAENITKGFGDKIVLDGVSFFVHEGDKIGVLGVNGTGKSTLLKILADKEFSETGNIILSNGARVSYLPQNPEFNEEMTVLEQVFKGLSDDDVDVIKYEAESILNKLGVSDHNQKLNTLSGGQRRRVSIASALVKPAEILILDEPTNHLDDEMVIWLEEYLKRFRGAIIMVTHDRYFLDRVTNKIVEIDRGHLYTYDANYSGFLELKMARDESMIASERKRQAILRREYEWIKRGVRARGTKSKGRIERYEELKNREGVAEKQKFEFSSSNNRLGRKIIEVNHISKSFGDKKIINDFDYVCTREDRIGIVGKNGAGKSTLLNMITGKLAPDSGNVDIGSTVNIGYFTQESKELDGELQALEYIKTIAEMIDVDGGYVTASQMMESFLFDSTMQYTKIKRLSGGERRRLFLVSILMSAPNVLILDEPTNDFDIQTLSVLEEYVRDFPGTVITVSHDRYFLDKTANSIIEVCTDGEINHYVGGYSDYKLKKKSRDNGNAGDDLDSGNVSRKNNFGVSSAANSGFDNSNSDKNAITDKTIDKKKLYKTSNLPKKLKFSFNEKKEYEQIDDDISALEESISEVELEMTKNSSDYTMLQELMEKKEKLEADLEYKTERWVYLNELAEKIEEQ